MGPVVLFDKSFLQSLTLDESVWFDHYFLTVICPYFFVETLADLSKPTRGERSSDQLVRSIADKFPDMHGTPCAFHVPMVLADLAGRPIPMTGQIPVVGGRPVKRDGRTGMVYDQSDEVDAFQRWQAGRFLEVERLFAAKWRRSLTSMPLATVAKSIAELAPGADSCRTLVEAKSRADDVVSQRGRDQETVRLALALVGSSSPDAAFVLSKWNEAGQPHLGTHAPYAAYYLTVELFFQFAVASSLISHARPSNRIDIAYLFYLPFSMAFVTRDSMQARCAPLFLRPNQDLLDPNQLKADLASVNLHFAALSDDDKRQSVFRIANGPPPEPAALIRSMWHKHLIPRAMEGPISVETSDARRREMVEQLSKIIESPGLPPGEVDFDTSDTDVLSIKRRVRRRKGSWVQIPDEIP